MARPILIFVSGIDGSGKSTLSTILYILLRRYNLPVVKIWFRFPYFISYPLLFIAQKIGITKTYHIDNKVFTAHFFERIAEPFKLLFIFDFTIHYILRIVLRLSLPIVLIVERGPLDSFIDLLSDIRRHNLISNGIITRYFIKLQNHGITIFTDASFSKLLQRRAEAKIDPKFRYRYLLYKLILLKFGKRYLYINTELPKNVNIMMLYKIASKISQLYGYKGYGKLFKKPYLKAFFAQRFVMVIVNWLFQGVTLADIIENIIRILIDCSAILFTFMVTSNYVYTLISFLIAHTFNYLFNSNGIHILRFFRPADPNKRFNIIMEYLAKQELSGIYAIAIFGSISRGEQSHWSDIDIRVIRKHGIKNAFKAYVFALKLRLTALRGGIPLDIFVHTISKLCQVVKRDELIKIITIPNNRKKEILSICQKI